MAVIVSAKSRRNACILFAGGEQLTLPFRAGCACEIARALFAAGEQCALLLQVLAEFLQVPGHALHPRRSAIGKLHAICPTIAAKGEPVLYSLLVLASSRR